MKKRLLTGLIAAAMLLQPYAACAQSAPLVYRVTDDQGHALYLLGTIHVGAEDMYPLGSAVEEAYENADVVAVEMDVFAAGANVLKSLKYSFSMMYLPPDNAKNHLSPETFALGVEKLGMGQAVLNQMKPAMWYSLAEEYVISAAGLDARLGVDYWLLKRAHADGKPIDELEGMEAQMKTLLAIPEEVIDLEVQAVLTYPEESLRLFLDVQEEGEAGYEETYEEYNDTLIFDRNDGFEEQAVAYLASGKTALMAIGAFHILGENGLAQKLARAGYHVEEIGR